MTILSSARVQELLGSMKGKRIAVVGDLMIDRYYWGSVTRISPEAPVPVVEVESESHRLGGAANVANNILSLGGIPILVGLVGDDHPGRLLTEMLEEIGIPTKGIVQDKGRPTTVKTRVIAHNQHVVRVDNESKDECPAHLQHYIVDAVRYSIQNLDGIVIEDYNKGAITPEIIAEIVSVANKYSKTITVDPKVNNFLQYKNVTVFKPNRRETEEMLGGKLDTLDDVRAAGLRLLELLSARHVLLTRGAEGMSLFSEDGHISHIPSVARHVHDVSGAGDTVISSLTLALASGASFEESAALANMAGGIVVGRVGIVSVKPADLLDFSREHEAA